MPQRRRMRTSVQWKAGILRGDAGGVCGPSPADVSRPHRSLLLPARRSGIAALPVPVPPHRVPRPSHGKQQFPDRRQRIGREPHGGRPSPPGVGEKASPARCRRRPPHGQMPQRHFRQPLSAAGGTLSVHLRRTGRTAGRGFGARPLLVGHGSFGNPGRARLAGGRENGQPRRNPQRRRAAHASWVRGHGRSLPDHDSRPRIPAGRKRQPARSAGNGLSTGGDAG